MVFLTYTLVMRPRNRHVTSTTMKELAHTIYANGGVIRRLTNEGIFRPYKKFRDDKGVLHATCRYWTLQVDMGETDSNTFTKTLQDHPDVLKHLWVCTEKQHHLHRLEEGRFPLDSFVRYDEEINWAPQVNA